MTTQTKSASGDRWSTAANFVIAALLFSILPAIANAGAIPILYSLDQNSGASVKYWANDSQFSDITVSDTDRQTDFETGAAIWGQRRVVTTQAEVFVPRLNSDTPDIGSAYSRLQTDATIDAQGGYARFTGEQSIQNLGGDQFLTYASAVGASNQSFTHTLAYHFQLDAATVVNFALQTALSATAFVLTEMELRGNRGQWAYLSTSTADLPVPESGPIEGTIRKFFSVALEAGNYEILLHDKTGSSALGGGPWGMSNEYESEFAFSFTGDTATNPVMPTSQNDDTFIFENVISGGYFDPIAADRYDFQMLDGSLFTSIDELPSFLVNPVTVMSGGTILGQYGAGQSVDFSALGGVSSFSILGINPTVNGDDPLAFPIKLSFNNAIADFSMTPISSGVSPVPEPSSLALMSIGGLIGAMRLRKRRTILGV